MSTKKAEASSATFAHLLNAPRIALDAMTRGEVLGLKRGALTDAGARALAKQIVVANEWRLGKQ
jgi:hypothetical protein